jgi:hypothetical protein
VSSLAHVVQLPKTFCGHEGVMECSGLARLLHLGRPGGVVWPLTHPASVLLFNTCEQRSPSACQRI